MKVIHRKIDIKRDEEYILERHCRVNYECDCPWKAKIPYTEYREEWFGSGQTQGFLGALEKSMDDSRTIAEIIETPGGTN